MRSPAEMDILQIDLTTACMLRCSNCTRLVAHFPKQWCISPEDFRTAIRSMKGWWQPGRVIGLIGGEPTLHPQFEEICRIFVEEFGDKTPLTNGRQPIANYNDFASERLFDRSNGRGLWTTPHESFYKHMEIIHDTFSHFNANDHFHDGLHKSLLITRQELGIPDEEWFPMRDACWVQNTWSASVRRDKVYFCEVAGALDDLYFDGQHGVPIHDGWWKRQPDEFIGPAGDQRNICEICCACVKNTPSAIAKDETDIVSPWHQRALEKIGSPAAKKDAVEVYQIGTPAPADTVIVSDDREHRKNRYMEDENCRVSQANDHIKPHKLSGVIVSVGYGGLLNETIYRNIKHFDQLVICTTPDDKVSQNVANDCGAKLVISAACYDNEDSFNKGRMLNAGFAALDRPDWVLFTDADILLNSQTGDFIRSHVLNPGCLYYTKRFEQESPANINYEPNGYFQLWNVRAMAIRDAAKVKRPCSENFCSAGGVDSHFMQQWPADKRIPIPEIPVTHYDHGAFAGNWNGVKERVGWRQVGMLTNTGFSSLRKDFTGPLRWTSSLTGESMESYTPQAPLRHFADDLAKGYHLHVAAYFPGEK